MSTSKEAEHHPRQDAFEKLPSNWLPRPISQTTPRSRLRPRRAIKPPMKQRHLMPGHFPNLNSTLDELSRQTPIEESDVEDDDYLYRSPDTSDDDDKFRRDAAEQWNASPTPSEVLGDLADCPLSPASEVEVELFGLLHGSPSLAEAHSPTPTSSFITAKKRISPADLQAIWDRDMAGRKRCRYPQVQAQASKKRPRANRKT